MSLIHQDLPYVVWYQCKKCTHLFYNEEDKIVAHLRDKHAYGTNSKNKNHPPGPTFKSTPLKIKEQHFRPVETVPSTSGTDGDGEDTYSDDIINNNNNSYTSSNPLLQKKMPKLYHKDDIMKGIGILQRKQVRRIIPSIEELKKQLVNSDIDISEIKVRNDEGEEIGIGRGSENKILEVNGGEIKEDIVDEVDDEGDGEDGLVMEFAEDYPEGYVDEYGDEQDMDDHSGEEASMSNQSFYDNDIGEHFLFKTGDGGDSESNYEDDGIVTPNFGMVDELYRRANIAATSSASSDPSSTGVRRRTFQNPCKICKKVFPSLSMLKKHAKTHLNEEGGSQHICKFCFDYFPSSAGLSRHLRVHTEENPNVCQVCAKSFTSWATLRTHMKIHSGERPFGCDQCGQRFQTKSTLDSHLRIHSGSRPHICPVPSCLKAFRTSSPLYRHMRSVHKGLTFGAVNS